MGTGAWTGGAMRSWASVSVYAGAGCILSVVVGAGCTGGIAGGQGWVDPALRLC